MPRRQGDKQEDRQEGTLRKKWSQIERHTYATVEVVYKRDTIVEVVYKRDNKYANL